MTAAVGSASGKIRVKEFHFPLSASCLAVTFTGLAERAGLAYTSLRVNADGVAGSRADGCFGFTRLVLQLEVETDPADGERAREIAREAEDDCLVSASLDLPVETVIEVRSATSRVGSFARASTI